MENTCTESKTVKLNLPVLIEDFQFALGAEDYELCNELKNKFYTVYSDFSDSLKKTFEEYLLKYLNEKEINNVTDLNGLFNEILHKKQIEI